MDEVALHEALDALARARERYWSERRSWSLRPETRSALKEAWDMVERVVPAEVAIRLHDIPECDAGAPMPMIVSDGSTTWLTYHFDGESDERALVAFEGVDSVLFGGPNDEALDGHRLSTRGLQPYSFHEVLRSEWIGARERENAVHDAHEPGWHARLRHFVYTFHDETFECLARRYIVGDLTSAHPAAVATQSPGESAIWITPPTE